VQVAPQRHYLGPSELLAVETQEYPVVVGHSFLHGSVQACTQSRIADVGVGLQVKSYDGVEVLIVESPLCEQPPDAFVASIAKLFQLQLGLFWLVDCLAADWVIVEWSYVGREIAIVRYHFAFADDTRLA
jgi:hypothetical protein